MNNHAKRVMTAAAGIPLVILFCAAGKLLFFGFVALLSSLALYEYYRLAERKGAKPLVVLGIISGFTVNLSFFHFRLRDFTAGYLSSHGIPIPFPGQTQLLVISLVVIVGILAVTELFRKNGSFLINLSTTISGILYISLFFGTFIGLRELFVPDDFPVYRYFTGTGSFNDPAVADEIYRWGGYTVMALFAMIWICDTAAYYAGSAFGRHKLFPRISPHKTWEGAVAGFIFAVLASVAAKQIALDFLPFGSAITIGVIVGLFGQLGDLIESSVKRDAGVKDSSSLFPGHGGVLDRFDSLLLVSPVVYLYLDYILFT